MTVAAGWWGPQVLDAVRAAGVETEAPGDPTPVGAAGGELARVARVVDGDTLLLVGGERVRLLNIDAPEMPARASCEREAALALEAKARLENLAPAGAAVTLRRDGEDRDRYGRLLRRLEVDGEDVGQRLTREGLAQTWRGRKAQWC
ncbi:thermonuclease family protein [Phenylobacterium deserti]|uniref:Thermonuclease family protein n=1 Tax=Phenylobacterium deserti TaxID=1914756 RepID=A0A328AGP9_9CAUL|nr:thermonuclease family protein [Phenylobacterium deserti]RAK52624.1 thermonuclease family protein [Phenylobacterium deserti]